MLEMDDLRGACDGILSELRAAKRPVLIYGAGIRNAADYAKSLQQALKIPLVVTWGARDIANADSFGTHGVKAGNMTVQNADYVLAVGTRLDTKATGSPASSFAPKAKLVMVDIDPTELSKMEKIGRPLYRSICADSKDFMRMMVVQGASELLIDAWRTQVHQWRAQYPVVLPEYRSEKGINPYVLIEKLSELMRPDDVLVSDTGCGLAWIMQAFKFKGQTFVHAFNQTPMGYGLPAAIGAAFATGRRVVLVTGDGGLSVNITELATVARHGLNIKILLLNNKGHAMCRQTQRQWLGGEYPATSHEGGLATPDFSAVALAYGIDALITSCDAGQFVKSLLRTDGPGFLECEISEDAGVYPQIKFGEPLAA